MQDGSAERLARYERIVAREHGCQVRALNSRNAMTQIEHDISGLEVAIDRARDELEEMRSAASGSDDSPERRRINDDIEDLEETIVRIDDERMTCAQKLGRIDEALDVLASERAEYMRLVDEWRTYELIINATSKKGIPAQILAQLVPTINAEIARILNGIVDFVVTLDMIDETGSLDVYIDYGDSARIIELASGMEKMIASIAIRVALINVSSLPKTDMLIIDEGFGELDESNIEACGTLLRSLTRWFKSLIIITHIDTLKDVVDNVIDITRDGKDARVG
jgi:DNA repair exonuclease SbcCD ATPase subunit